MSRYSDVTNAVTQLEIAKGNAAAEAQRQSGQIWGGAIANIGNLVANLPGQIAQAKRLDQQTQMGNIELQQAKANQAGQTSANNILAKYSKQNADGSTSWDTAGIQKDMAAGNVPMAIQSQTLKALDDVNTSVQRFHTSRINDGADVANALLQLPAGTLKDPNLFGAALDHLRQNEMIGDQDVQSLKQIVGQGSDPTPILQAIRAKSEKYKQSYEPVPEGSPGILNKGTGGITPTGFAPKTDNESKLAMDAASLGTPQETPTAAQSKAALDLLKVSKGTAEQDDQRYRNIQAALTQRQPVTPDDLAWAKGYEKQKTLGVDTSASAAAQRQATAINAQVAQQGRAQGFQEAQAGRKELTEKVEQPYQTALTSAQTLRDVVASAKAGNKIAANLQNLETTMAAIRAQGLNRINTTEIGVAANAGNLWDRIQGRIGALTAGQAVPPDLQKNMEEFAGILEKSAYAKYRTGFDATTKRYNLADEKPMAAPGAPAGGISVQAPNGKTYTFQSQADADAFKAKAGIK